MKDIDLDKIEKDIETGQYERKDLKRLPDDIRRQLFDLITIWELKKISEKIYYEPRDWTKLIDDFDLTGIISKKIYLIQYATISFGKGWVQIGGTPGPLEIFKTKKKLDSFIDALSQARDAVFGE